MKKENNLLMMWASIASMSVALTLILLKTIAYLMTGSIAILSTLFDSIQDIMTSGINLMAVKHAIEPADKQHRFGHGKAQAIGGLAQAIIIFFSAIILIIQSFQRFQKNSVPEDIHIGFTILVIALILTSGLLLFQRYAIKKTNSLSIRADMAHYTGDIGMDIGVMISLTLSSFCQTGWIDALFGIGVGIYLCKVTYSIALTAIHMLMDTEMPHTVRQTIKKVIYLIPDVKKLKDLRTRQSGTHLFIQITLLLNGQMSLYQAHKIADKAERLLKRKFHDSEVIIHLEPSKK